MDFPFNSNTSSPTSANTSSTNTALTPIIMDFCAGLDSTLYTAEDLMSENLHIPENITHAQVDADPILKRLQQDLIVLTSFRDNETLHWRPTWFPQEPFAERFWTLHNPPNVVTEYCGPSSNKGNTPFDFTRRMRREDDPQPLYVKSWEQWDRYCESCGVPKTFLNNDMVNLIRLGLQRDEKGQIMEPPKFPLYPEPQPLGHGRYLLDPISHHQLPTKFHKIDKSQVIVVHSTGKLEVMEGEPFYHHSSQWTHFDGYGGYQDDYWYNADPDAPTKYQSKGRRWSYLPWTREQESSCKPFKVKLRVTMGESQGRKLGQSEDMKLSDGEGCMVEE